MAAMIRLVILLCILSPLVTSQISTFSNPIVDFFERDAVIMKLEDFYYLVHVDRGTWELRIFKSPFLTDFRYAQKEVILRLPSGSSQFFPSFFFNYKSELYVYFHSYTQGLGFRMFVIMAQDSTNPMGAWSAPVPILDHIWNKPSFNGATLHLNEKLYFVWTGPSNSDSKISLYIAQMLNPTTVVEPVVLLREPKEDWECHGGCWLEGPAFLYNCNKAYMVFSGSESHEPESALSYMSIQTGLDPMNISNWESYPGPVLQPNTEEGIYSIRFPEFTTSPDNTETWMLYTASNNSADIYASSRIRIEQIKWDKLDGSPKFPQARANGVQQVVPSGEPERYTNAINNNMVPYVDIE